MLSGTDPSRSRGCAQPGEQPNAGITVRRCDAILELIVTHGLHGRAADAAVAAAGVEAERRQAALQLLQFRDRWRAFGAGKRLHKRAVATNAVAEMHDRERIAESRV